MLRPDSHLASLAWVQHRSRRWEPEPLRWVAINVARRLASWNDDYESCHDGSSRLATLLDRVIGR